ncbi:MAG: hypothetical protein AMJ46_02025 [Latescibacteria bacterium DG_63]|nr:MAG: hypothetical protein AMJ46_02025 [Latescibacteria bacterium DG_63]
MKKVILLSTLLALCILPFCVSGEPQKDNALEFVLEQLWATDKVFKTPESVLYDEKRGVIYVSNICGSPGKKDGNGFISKLGLDGAIQKLKWIEGLDAPKGLGVFEDKLYVTDLNQVVEISIEEGKILKKYKSNKARFLNDISVDTSGCVYASDNMASIIFRLKDGKLEPWLDSRGLEAPNGLLAEKRRLLAGTDGCVLRVDYKTKRFTRFIEDTDYIDGLVSYGKGDYLVSDFLGAVHLVHAGKEKIKVLDTTSEKMMAADIDFIADKGILLVPTFSDNRVVAYKFK